VFSCRSQFCVAAQGSASDAAGLIEKMTVFYFVFTAFCRKTVEKLHRSRGALVIRAALPIYRTSAGGAGKSLWIVPFVVFRRLFFQKSLTRAKIVGITV
jgi:hypothetical protein